MTRKRLALGVLALAVLAVSAGCTSPFGGGPSEERLNENATYEWNASTDVYVNVTSGQYHAVYDVENFEGREFEIWQPGIDGRNPVNIAALRYRYPNGTTVTVSTGNLSVEQRGGATVVMLPQSNGSVAFTARSDEKSLVLPSYMAGSYEVVLPENMRVGFPVFSRVAPGATERTLEGDRVHLQFDELDRTLNVQWYLARDLWLFAGLVAILTVVGAGGVGYYLYQIRKLEEKREDLGLDVSDDDDGRDPPPGMG